MSSTQDSAQTFNRIVTNYLTQTQQLQDTVNQLTTPIDNAYETANPNNTGPDSAESLLWSLWQAMIQVAQQLPYDDQKNGQDRLVALFAELQARPDPAVPADKLAAVQDKIPWSLAPIRANLAIWGWQLRESFDVLDPMGGSQKGTASANQWINLNAFLARLTNAGVSDQSFLGLAVLKEVLEIPQESWSGKSAEAQNAGVGAAAVWLLVMGETWSEDGWTDASLAGRKPPMGSLWQGDPFVIDQARVQFWVNRLSDLVSQTPKLAEQYKALADDAVQSLNS